MGKSLIKANKTALKRKNLYKNLTLNFTTSKSIQFKFISSHELDKLVSNINFACTPDFTLISELTFILDLISTFALTTLLIAPLKNLNMDNIQK